jgi:hypothetical protein
MTAIQLGPPNRQAFAASFTPVIATSDYVKVTLTGNITVHVPVIPSDDGMQIILEFTQDGTGGRTITFDAGYKNVGQFTLLANTITTMAFRYDAVAVTWVCQYTATQGGNSRLTPQINFPGPGVITLDCGFSQEPIFDVVLGGNASGVVFSNLLPTGIPVAIIVKWRQDGTGSRIPTHAAGTYKWPGNLGQPTFSIGANVMDTCAYYTDNNGATFMCAAVGFGYVGV